MVIRTVQPPVILKKEPLGASRMQRDLVHTLAELGIFVRRERYADAAVLCGPGRAAVVGSINAAGGNSDIHAPSFHRVRHNCVQRQPSVAGRPSWTMGVVEQPAHQMPRFAIIVAFEECGGLGAAIKYVGLVWRARGNLPDVFQRYARIRREPDWRLLRIGPAFAEVVAGPQHGSPVA